MPPPDNAPPECYPDPRSYNPFFNPLAKYALFFFAACVLWLAWQTLDYFQLLPAIDRTAREWGLVSPPPIKPESPPIPW